MAWEPEPDNPWHRIGGPKSAFMFKELTDTEEQEYRQYAQENDPPNYDSWLVYHPVCREVWIERGVGLEN